MQRVVNTTIEEEVFSMDPPRNFISGPVVNESDSEASSRQSRKNGLTEE
jgi:hypothetical protein